MPDPSKPSDGGSTRRTRRKGDDLEPSGPSTSKRKQPSAKTGGTKRKSAAAKRSSSTPRKQQRSTLISGGRTGSPSTTTSLGEQRANVMSALKNANVSDDVLSAISAQFTQPSNDSQSSADVVPSLSPKHRRTSSRQGQATVQKRSSRLRQTRDRDQEQEEDEEEEDDDDILDVPDSDSNPDDDDEDVLEQPVQDEHLAEDTGDAPNVHGQSDEEQEVSINIGSSNATPGPALPHETEATGDGRDVPQVGEVPAGVTASGIVPSTAASTGIVRSIPPSVSGGLGTPIVDVNSGKGHVDQSILLNIVGQLKSAMFAEINSLFSQVLSELKNDRNQIRKLKEHVTELTSIITTTASTIFIKQNTSNSRTKEIHRKLCLLPIFFNDNFMLKVLPKVVVGFLSTSVVSGSAFSDLQLQGVEFFSVLHFSIQPNEKKKSKYSTDLGQLYSKFRYSLLMSSILAMQDNVFNTFKRSSTPDDVLGPTHARNSEEISTVGPILSALPQPFWLHAGYILATHCVAAAKKHEKRGGADGAEDSQSSAAETSSQTAGENDSVDTEDSSVSNGKQSKASRTGPLTKEEIATEAASLVYRTITGILYRARVASKVQLFNDITYLFTGWAQYGVLVDQKTLRIQWESQISSETDYTDDLPRTKVLRPHERLADLAQEAHQVDLDNITHLETLIGKHPELSLLIEHDVLVSGHSRRLHFRINLIEVAARELASYITLESAAKGKDALSVDKRCLKTIMTLAVGLRRLIEKPIEDLTTDQSVLWSGNHCSKGKRGRPKGTRAASRGTTNNSTTYAFEIVNGLSIEQLLPPPSKQKELLNSVILNLTPEEFEARSVTTVGGGEHMLGINLGVGVNSNNEARIEVDETQGVFGF